MMVYGPALPEVKIDLDKAIQDTVMLLKCAWARFDQAEQEMVEESIYEVTMLEVRLRRLLKEKKGEGVACGNA